MTEIHNNAVLISNHKNTVQTDRFRVVAQIRSFQGQRTERAGVNCATRRDGLGTCRQKRVGHGRMPRSRGRSGIRGVDRGQSPAAYALTGRGRMPFAVGTPRIGCIEVESPMRRDPRQWLPHAHTIPMPRTRYAMDARRPRHGLRARARPCYRRSERIPDDLPASSRRTCR